MQIESVTEYQPKLISITLELNQDQALYMLYCLGTNSQPDKLYVDGGSLYGGLFDHLKTALGVDDEQVYDLSCLAAGKENETIGDAALETLFS